MIASSPNWTREATAVCVRGVDLAVRLSAGPGALPLFVWGHGLLMSMEQEDAVDVFAPLVEAPSKEGPAARWMRYDARGHGGSGATYDPADYEWPALARDLLELIERVDGARTVLGGVSMGCATSLYAAHLDPGRVGGLVLMGPPAAWETRPRQAMIYRIAAGIVGTVGLGAFRFMSSVGSVLGGRQGSVVTRMRRALVDHLAKADERSVVAALRGAAASDLPTPEEISRLDVPTLILAWRGDPAHPVSTARRLAEVMPRAELSIARGLSEIRVWPRRVHQFVGACVSRI